MDNICLHQLRRDKIPEPGRLYLTEDTVNFGMNLLSVIRTWVAIKQTIPIIVYPSQQITRSSLIMFILNQEHLLRIL